MGRNDIHSQNKEYIREPEKKKIHTRHRQHIKQANHEAYRRVGWEGERISL
jgi:hypothetical protein